MQANSVTLSEVEHRGLLDGSVSVLWRRVEPPIPPLYSDPAFENSATPDIATWRHDYEFERWKKRQCPLGQPGDVLLIGDVEFRIAAVSVVRVCEITEDAALASGFKPGSVPSFERWTAAEAFREWWTAQHGAGSWEDWAWKVEVERTVRT